ncbi:34452_t:CDS:2, partial [Racocetra persica]
KPSESELGGTELDESELDENMLDENELGRSELDKSELEAIESDIPKDIEEYSKLIDQPVIIEDILTDEDIIEMVKHDFKDNSEVSDDNNEPPPPPLVTVTEAVKALKKVIRY